MNKTGLALFLSYSRLSSWPPIGRRQPGDNDEPLDNHAAYLKSWLEGMHGDPNYIFKASRQASKVCDFLLSFVRQAETEPVKNELVEAA